MKADLFLSSGRVCRVTNPQVPLLPHYHVLYFPEAQGPPSEAEVDEMIVLSRRVGRRLGQERFGDPECFSVLYNGARTRRRRWTHVHILPAASVSAKRFALLCLLAKRWLRRGSRLARALRKSLLPGAR